MLFLFSFTLSFLNILFTSDFSRVDFVGVSGLTLPLLDYWKNLWAKKSFQKQTSASGNNEGKVIPNQVEQVEQLLPFILVRGTNLVGK